MIKSELLEKIKKNSSIKETSVITESQIYGKKDMIQTEVPMINVALSGKTDGGLTPGLLVLAGKSKHFKTAFALLMAASYQKKHPDGIVLFYDSEFGTPESYFESFDIDMERVIHTPVTDVEKLKHDVMQQLNGLERGDKVCIIVDSIGNLASKKEVEDALEGKSVADMTRAKAIKSLFRMVTPHLTLKDIPMIVVNHVYDSMSLFPTAVVSGGCVEKGTKIWTVEGLKNIEDIVENELVLTLDGEKIVTHSWNPDTLEEGYKECYEIEFEDGYRCVVSEDHKFLVDNKWVEAKDLTKNSDVINTSIKQKETDIWYTTEKDTIKI